MLSLLYFQSESAIYRRYIMKFAFIPKGQYTIGQIIQVHGQSMRVESYTHTGRNVIVCTLDDAPKFQRIACICTDSPSILGVTA